MALSPRRKLLLFPRVVLATFAFIITVLIAHIISTSYWNAIPRQGGNAAPVNFALFLGVWVLFLTPFYIWAALYLSPHPGREAAIDSGTHERQSMMLLRILTLVDALCLILYFSGAVAMSAGLGVHSCSNHHYTHSNGITNSSPNTKDRCRQAQASTAFLWFSFLTFGAILWIEYRAMTYSASPGMLDAKMRHHEAMQAGGVEMRNNGGQRVRPPDFYGLDENGIPVRPDFSHSDVDTEHTDRNNGDSVFERQEYGGFEADAEPLPDFAIKRSSPITVAGKKISAAWREVKKRMQRDEW